ncbi:DUF6301 family protein [Nocardia sp. NPDC024068]|uniref:DUF6301 family protein n=1 Tax=Nocardia sp. NPDC024068 TaxID=3157197 RepID=UPI0033E5B0E6
MTEWRVIGDAEVAELAERLRSLRWSWQLADFADLAEIFGWRIEMSDSSSWVMFDSGLGMTSGKALGHDGIVDDIRVMLTDFADADASRRDRIRDLFARYAGVVTEALGEPSYRLPGNAPEVRWAGPSSTLSLRALSTTVSLHLSTNSSLALQDMATEAQGEDSIDQEQQPAGAPAGVPGAPVGRKEEAGEHVPQEYPAETEEEPEVAQEPPVRPPAAPPVDTGAQLAEARPL